VDVRIFGNEDWKKDGADPPFTEHHDIGYLPVKLLKLDSALHTPAIKSAKPYATGI
jgi:hypothetical protein